jgi:hypothetical protein
MVFVHELEMPGKEESAEDWGGILECLARRNRGDDSASRT